MTTSFFSKPMRDLLAGTAVIALSTAAAQAQPNIQNDTRLSDVLNRFASDANVEVMFSEDVGSVEVKAPSALTGDTRNDLNLILENTGLHIEEPTQDVFIITTASVNTVPTVIGKSSDMSAPGSKDEVVSFRQEAQIRDLDAEPMSLNSGQDPSMSSSFDFEAPTGVITGRVVDGYTGQPLAGAFVLIDGADRSATTDQRGFFRFATAPVGSYNLSINYLGAAFEEQRVTLVSGQEVNVNFVLGEALQNTGDEIIVYANKSALQQALNQQRAATNSSTVVSSDLLGDFPAETISEALRRVSGVTFSRDSESGEGDRLTVRGFNEQAINIQLNGVNLQGTGVDRGIDLSGFLTDNIKQVTIQKSLLPSQEASGTGGLVEIETRSGLDYGDKYLSLAGEIETPFAGGFGQEYEFSATGAYQLADNLGLSATLQYRDTDAENFDVNFLQVNAPVLPEGFTSTFRLPESFDYPFVSEVPGPLQTGANYFARERDEQNLTLSLNAAYDYKDHTRLRLDFQRIDNDRGTSAARTTASNLTASTDLPIPELGGDVRRRTYIRAFRPTLGINDAQQELLTTSLSFRGETDIDKWEFDYKIGFSETENRRSGSAATFLGNQNANVADLYNPVTSVFNPDDNAAMTPRFVGGAVGVQGDGIPVLNLTQTGLDFLTDAANYNGLSANLFDATDRTTNYIYEADARRYFENSVLDYIEIGGRLDDRTRRNSDDVLSTTNVITSQSFVRIFGQNTPLSDLLAGGFAPRDLSQIGLGDTTIPFLDYGASLGVIDGIRGLLEDDPNTPENEARFNLTDRTQQNPFDDAGAISPSKVTEKIYAGYVESKIDIGDLEVVGGVRFQREERTGNIISAPSVRNESGQLVPRTTLADLGLVEFRNTETSDDTWTPSVIANYRPSERAVIRGAFFRSTINPSINQISRPTTFSIDQRPNFLSARIREPNPNLKPSVTDNFDLDFSYYFEDNPGLVRLGLFYKDISNNFTSVLVADEEAGLEIRDRIVQELGRLAEVDPALLVIPDDAEFTIQQPRNGDGGSIYGMELELIRQIDFLPEAWPDFLENFSVLGNLTYTKSEFDVLETARNDDGDLFTLTLEDLPLERQSEWAGNASVRYEDGKFSGSLIYTYQSEAASSYDEFNLNGIIPEFDTLDLRLSYIIDRPNMPRFIIFAEGDDLLRSAKDADVRAGFGSQFANSGPDYFFPTQLQFNGGRRFTVGARVNF